MVTMLTPIGHIEPLILDADFRAMFLWGKLVTWIWKDSETFQLKLCAEADHVNPSIAGLWGGEETTSTPQKTNYNNMALHEED